MRALLKQRHSARLRLAQPAGGARPVHARDRDRPRHRPVRRHARRGGRGVPAVSAGPTATADGCRQPTGRSASPTSSCCNGDGEPSPLFDTGRPLTIRMSLRRDARRSSSRSSRSTSTRRRRLLRRHQHADGRPRSRHARRRRATSTWCIPRLCAAARLLPDLGRHPRRRRRCARSTFTCAPIRSRCCRSGATSASSISITTGGGRCRRRASRPHARRADGTRAVGASGVLATAEEDDLDDCSQTSSSDRTCRFPSRPGEPVRLPDRRPTRRIGTFVEIQRGAVIGRDCKISSHTFICEGVTLEDGVFVGHGVMFTNDLYPRAVNADGSLQTEADWPLVPTRVQARRVDRQQRHHSRRRHDRRRRAGRRRRGGHQGRAAATRSSPACRRVVIGTPRRTLSQAARSDRADRSRRCDWRRRHRLRLLGTEPGPQLLRDARLPRGVGQRPAARAAGAASERGIPTVDTDAGLPRPACRIRASTRSRSRRRCRTPLRARACRRSQAGKHVLVEKPMTATPSRRSGWSTRPTGAG